MRRTIDVVLIVGFLFLDWLRFHDILKPELPTVADWLTAALSLLVFYVAARSLVARTPTASTAWPGAAGAWLSGW
jgi:hypothetical protein